MNIKILFLPLAVACFFSSKAQYLVSTVGGNGTQGLVDGPATTVAELYWPYGLTFDGDSVIYFSDGANHCVRKISANTGKITTIAGNGTPALVDGIGAAARFNYPDDMFYKNGFLYVSDNQNNAVRKIDLSNNSVTTIAGTGTAGYTSSGTATSALLRNPGGIVVDKYNDIYFADCYNYCIRKISGGIISTIAGVGNSFGYVDGAALTAKFHRPRYIAMDTATGAIFITDINNNVIRKLYNNQVSTFSGTGAAGGLDGAYNVATFSAPVGIAITVGGYLYVVDGGGNKIRKVDPSGTVSTIAGNGVFGFQDGAAANAEFYYPQGICYDKNCKIYVADRNNNRIRRINVPEGVALCSMGIDTYSPIENNLNVYPNPNTGIVSVQINRNNENVSYKVFNVIGKEVKAGTLTYLSNHVDLKEFDNGIYTIVISDSEGTRTGKISLQK